MPPHRVRRTRFTPEQRAALLEAFAAAPLPSRQLRVALAAKLGVTPRVVQVFAQNQRQLVRRRLFVEGQKPAPVAQAIARPPQTHAASQPAASQPAESTRATVADELSAVEALLWLGIHGRVPCM